MMVEFDVTVSLNFTEDPEILFQKCFIKASIQCELIAIIRFQNQMIKEYDINMFSEYAFTQFYLR